MYRIEDFILKVAYKIINKRISKGWNLDGYLFDLEPGIKAFCERKLGDENFVKYNKEKAAIFNRTLIFIEDENPMLWEYITQNLGYYWD